MKKFEKHNSNRKISKNGNKLKVINEINDTLRSKYDNYYTKINLNDITISSINSFHNIDNK
jgi:hypothetical protein